MYNKNTKLIIECQVCGTMSHSNEFFCSNKTCRTNLSIKDLNAISELKEEYKKEAKAHKNEIKKYISQQKCKECKFSNSHDAQYCKRCGEKLFKEKKVTIRKCEICRSEYDASYDFCPKDGSKIVAEESIVQNIPKQKNGEKIPPQEDELKGIGGWLGYFAFFILVSPIINIVSISISQSIFLFGNFLEIGVMLSCIFLLFNKKKIFIQVWIAFAIFGCIHITFFYFNAANHTSPFLLGHLIRNYVITIIWSCYLLNSKRVKNTLIN